MSNLVRKYKDLNQFTYYCTPDIYKAEISIIANMEGANTTPSNPVNTKELKKTLKKYLKFVKKINKNFDIKDLRVYVDKFYKKGFAGVIHLRTNFLILLVVKMGISKGDVTNLTAFESLTKRLDDYAFFDNFHVKPLERFLPISNVNWRDGHTVLLNLFMSIYTRGQKIEDIIDFKNEVSRVDEDHYYCKSYKYSALLELRGIGMLVLNQMVFLRTTILRLRIHVAMTMMKYTWIIVDL
jgi:hypothetical protein